MPPPPRQSLNDVQLHGGRGSEDERSKHEGSEESAYSKLVALAVDTNDEQNQQDDPVHGAGQSAPLQSSSSSSSSSSSAYTTVDAVGLNKDGVLMQKAHTAQTAPQQQQQRQQSMVKQVLVKSSNEQVEAFYDAEIDKAKCKTEAQRAEELALGLKDTGHLMEAALAPDGPFDGAGSAGDMSKTNRSVIGGGGSCTAKSAASANPYSEAGAGSLGASGD